MNTALIGAGLMAVIGVGFLVGGEWVTGGVVLGIGALLLLGSSTPDEDR